MNEQRGRETREEHGVQNSDTVQHNRQSGALSGFEGMNYEQRRGSYRGNNPGSESEQTGGEHNSGMRQEDL